VNTWTVLRILEWSTQFLRDRGCSSPRLDAELLLSHALGCERIQLYTQFDKPLSDAERARYKTILVRRGRHEPIAYILGSREFFSLDFIVSPNVLIPRPETELLVEKVLENTAVHRRVLDWGTGSGCIAITLATHRPEWEITALDISRDALIIARKNALRHACSDRITFIDSSTMINNSFDIIISNPPYIVDEEYTALMSDVRDFEPKQALAAGPEGMTAYTELFKCISHHAADECMIVIETAPSVAEGLRSLALHAGLEGVALHTDYAGAVRMLTGEIKKTTSALSHNGK